MSVFKNIDFQNNKCELVLHDQFFNLKEVIQWSEQPMDKPANIAMRLRMVSGLSSRFAEGTSAKQRWYGSTPNSEIIQGARKFQAPDLLQKFMDKVTDLLPPDVLHTLKKKKLGFNENFGDFSYARAAAGLYALNEYYSPSRDAVVDEKSVQTARNGSGYVLAADATPVIKRKQRKENGKIHYRTSIKKTFAWFPEKTVKKRAVELISITGHGSDKSAEQILYSAAAVCVVGDLLAKAGYQLKVSGLRVVYDPSKRTKRILSVYHPVNNVHETLDIDSIALVVADPAFFRWVGFNMIIKANDDYGIVGDPHLGYAVNKSDKILSILKQTDFFETREDPDMPYLLFDAVYSEAAALSQITDAINHIALLQQQP